MSNSLNLLVLQENGKHIELCLKIKPHQLIIVMNLTGWIELKIWLKNYKKSNISFTMASWLLKAIKCAEKQKMVLSKLEQVNDDCQFEKLSKFL